MLYYTLMESDLAQQAITAALSSDWKTAILFNSQLVKINPTDIDALNRLARAYAEDGNLDKAKLSSQKVLKIDRLNPIATKCLAKWKNFKAGSGNMRSMASPSVFIEEPNRTKIINLINLGSSANVVNLACGDNVKIVPHMHRVNVMTNDDKLIGRFPDDLASKFIKLMKLGNTYDVVIKSADKTQVKIFVRTLHLN